MEFVILVHMVIERLARVGIPKDICHIFAHEPGTAAKLKNAHSAESRILENLNIVHRIPPKGVRFQGITTLPLN